MKSERRTVVDYSLGYSIHWRFIQFNFSANVEQRYRSKFLVYTAVEVSLSFFLDISLLLLSISVEDEHDLNIIFYTLYPVNFIGSLSAHILGLRLKS